MSENDELIFKLPRQTYTMTIEAWIESLEDNEQIKVIKTKDSTALMVERTKQIFWVKL